MQLSLIKKSVNRYGEMLAYVVLCLIVLVILIVRAINVPVTHDEATTYFNYVQTADFVPFLAKGEANNHFLNSFITYIFVQLFGSSPLALRLSNLVFAPLYFFFCYKISRELSSTVLRWIFLPVMVFTFHIMEFFALTRGYGLSLTFLAGAIWQVFMASHTGDYRHYLYSNLFMFLSSLSILLEIYNFTLLLAWSLAMIVFTPGQRKFKKFTLVSLTGIIPVLFIMFLTLYLKKGGAYIEMGPTGLWNASLKTLFSFIIETNFYQAQKPLLIFSILTVLPLFILLSISVLKKRWHIHPHMLFAYLLFGNLIIIVVVVKLFFSHFPESRLVLFLFPIAVSTIVFTVDRIIGITTKKIFFILALPLLFFPIQSVKLMNFKYVTWYNRCHVPMIFYDKVMADYNEGEIPPTIGCHGTQKWTWQYLARQKGGKANEMTTDGFPNRKSQYLIMDINEIGLWKRYYDTIGYDPVSNLYLFKKKDIHEKIKEAKTDYQVAISKTNSENAMLLEQNITEFKDKSIEMDFDLSLKSFDKILYGAIVIAINDSTGRNLIYDQIHLNWIREHWNGEPHNFLRSWLFPVLPRDAATVRVYLWNIKKSDFAINHGKITLNELK